MFNFFKQKKMKGKPIDEQVKYICKCKDLIKWYTDTYQSILERFVSKHITFESEFEIRNEAKTIFGQYAVPNDILDIEAEVDEIVFNFVDSCAFDYWYQNEKRYKALVSASDPIADYSNIDEPIAAAPRKNKSNNSTTEVINMINAFYD